LKLSDFIEQNPEIKDISPLIAYEKGAVAVDARIILEDDVVKRVETAGSAKDNQYYAKGEFAKSNAQLVARSVGIIKELGYKIASPQEARDILGLKKV
jgi:hypothetical protein